jgi:hypothetical protein
MAMICVTGCQECTGCMMCQATEDDFSDRWRLSHRAGLNYQGDYILAERPEGNDGTI